MNSVVPQRSPAQSSSNLTGSKIEQESLLPELLHALNQPLTSLRCSLELTLLQPRDSEEYRKRLRESLHLTEEIVVLSSGIRELLDVEQPSGLAERVALEKVLESSVRELLPLAEAQEIGLSLLCSGALPAQGDAQRYLGGLLYFLGFLFSFASKSDEIKVEANPGREWIGLKLVLTKADCQGSALGTTEKQKAGAARSYLRLLIARRIFEIEGGSVLVEQEKDRICLSIQVPIHPEARQAEMLCSPDGLLQSA